MADLPDDRLLVMFAVKLVQPGLLGDVSEGLVRLLPKQVIHEKLKMRVRGDLESLIERGLVCLYAGRRYLLTSKGESVVEESGIRHKIEARRIFLLKETRKDMKRMRSDTRNRPLKQWPS